jgi:peptide/nickel transport system ATP-binding protein
MRLVPNPGRIIGGKIIFQDKDILRINESEMRSIRGSRIAMSFQDPMTFLNPVLKVGEQIAESIKLNQRLEKDESMEKAIKTMELVHVSSSRAYDYPHQLSGGMRQRVLLAIAISCKPALLIADEPTTSLDVITQIRILEMLNDLRNKLRISMMLITHDIGVVQKTADKVAVMYAGNILEYGDTRTIIHSPIHPYTRALLESI